MIATAPAAGPFTGLAALLTFDGVEKAAAYQGDVSVMRAKVEVATGMVSTHVTVDTATGWAWMHDSGETDGVLYTRSEDAQAAAILFGATRSA